MTNSPKFSVGQTVVHNTFDKSDYTRTILAIEMDSGYLCYKINPNDGRKPYPLTIDYVEENYHLDKSYTFQYLYSKLIS